MEEAEEDAGDGPIDLLKVQTFDRYDVAERCKELMRRLSNSAGSPQCKWDILELMEESHHQLRDVRQVHSDPDRGIWQELQSAVGNEHTASTLPVSLRKQCEEILARRKIWLGDFDTELNAILARGKEVRERLLFEDMDRASWFSAAGVSSLEVQRLLERHAEMHQRAARLARQLKLLSRGLQQQGALSSRRRAFQAKTVGEKLQSSLVCLAAAGATGPHSRGDCVEQGAHPDWTKKGGDGVPNSPKIVQDLKQTKGRQLVNKATSEDMRMQARPAQVAVAPVPGSSEMWLATTTMMLGSRRASGGTRAARGTEAA
ncbi:Exonuclease mut-7-like [Durusdinium trenchii]|uniref:Exonuclease mut-7-like n=1 Tax=Durusdinium trenchii TaxID=1381693 RepID=A0ABP0IY35_9DINO